MKFWVDKTNTAPEGYVWCKTVEDARIMIKHQELVYAKSNNNELYQIEAIDVVPYPDTHAATMEFRDWLRQTNRDHYSFSCHGCCVTHEHNALAELINDYFGCDAAYYDVDALALANHLLQHGVKLCPAASDVSEGSESCAPCGCRG